MRSRRRRISAPATSPPEDQSSPTISDMSAHAVAAELRRRIPNLPTKKLHKLVYYCQGHHLARFDDPLFSDTIVAWDMGPVVSQLWWAENNLKPEAAPAIVDEAALNTIEYVVSRYGRLTGRDLENLTHSEAPWKLADERRRNGGPDRIDITWIKGYFRTAEDDEDGLSAEAAAAVSAWAREAAAAMPATDDLPFDNPEQLLARLARR